MSLGADLLERLGQLSRMTPHFRGRGLLQRHLQKGLERLGVRGELCVVVDGVTWYLDLSELIQFRIFWDGGHDSHVLRWLLQESRRCPAPVLWDVGANVGAVACRFARHVPQAMVEAFEPSPRVFAKLAKNLGANPALSVRPHHLGLGDREGCLPFHESAEAGNGGLGSLFAGSNVTEGTVEVAVARGDELIREGRVNAPHLLKIDVEGFEPEVLEGLRVTIETHRPTLCVESASYRLRERGLGDDAIVEALRGLGYRVSLIDTSGERSLRLGDLSGNVDLIARWDG